MNRVTGLLLIVFLTISSFSAHAGMVMDAADDSRATHQQLPSHGHPEGMTMDAGDTVEAYNSGHVSSCSLGHCAIACGLILSQFSFTASEFATSSDHWMGDYRLVGKATAFEPPPPKV